jgi:hypothetical protein
MAKQNCTLSYSELNELSGRLFVLADFTLADRQAAADMRNAARAVSDLSSLRFRIQELVTEINAFIERTPMKPEHMFDIHMQVESCAGELLGLLGYGQEAQESEQ